MLFRHRSHHRFARALAAGSAVAVLAATPALARIDPPPTDSFNDRPVVVRTVDDGFDWGSAAVGAGAAGALIALASLAAFATTSRRSARLAS